MILEYASLSCTNHLPAILNPPPPPWPPSSVQSWGRLLWGGSWEAVVKQEGCFLSFPWSQFIKLWVYSCKSRTCVLLNSTRGLKGHLGRTSSPRNSNLVSGTQTAEQGPDEGCALDALRSGLSSELGAGGWTRDGHLGEGGTELAKISHQETRWALAATRHRKEEQHFKRRQERAQVQREREAVWPECNHQMRGSGISSVNH